MTESLLPDGAEEIALVAAVRAGDLIRGRFRSLARGDVREKGRNDFVTEVDHGAERLIVDTLRQHFPDHSMLAEEGTGLSGSGPWQWVIDPLDGTTNFIQGVPMVAVSIALRSGGVTVLGVVHNPLLPETYLAVRGRGVNRNGEPLRVSEGAAVEGALGATGFPFKRPAVIPAYADFLRSLLPRVKDLRRCGSAALDLAYTAAGIFDFFFEAQLFPWDFMAGALLVEEAGGRVTDFAGGPLPSAESSVLAANPARHGALLPEIGRFFRAAGPA